MADQSPLLYFLANPASVGDLDDEGWSLLFAECRATALLSRAASVLSPEPLDRQVPDRFRHHLISARREGDALMRDVRRELGFLAKAVEAIPRPVILLKGAAYVAAGLPPSRGRTFSDIDILVSREHLAAAESALMMAGWKAAALDAYDQRYYRQWSHEVPPMLHLQRGTTVDLHHSLVMPTCRLRVDSVRMIADAVPIQGSRWWRLRDEDLVLHAASHLLLNSEFDRSLRDLWDIDLLLRHFSEADAGFSCRVLTRADEVGLSRIAVQALALCHHYFRTPIPESAARETRGMAMRLVRCASSTRHPDTRPRFQSLAEGLLMIRELSLRLPPHLLLRHLLHKIAEAAKPPVQMTPRP